MRHRRRCTCGIPSCTRNSGNLLTGMLCEMGDRGSDSAGVAVYGDPTWSPPGHGCVSLLEVDASPRRGGGRTGCRRCTQLDATSSPTAQALSEDILAAARSAYPDALVAGFGADLAVLKGVGHPRD